MRAQKQRGQGSQVEGRAVLVVEDDQETLNVISRTLASGGFDVAWARNADDALQLLGRHHRKIELLLADVVLPDLSGPALVTRAMELYPDLRVVYVSAYDLDTIRAHGVEPDLVPFLPKPYEPSDLLRVVTQALQ